jgi:membrane-associated protease RseP (regulator of RpoE activity)
MIARLWVRGAWCLAIVAGALVCGAAVTAQEQPGTEVPANAAGDLLRQRVVLAAPDGQQVVAYVNEEAPPASEYWIGLACDAEPLNATLRAQLGIAEGRGLVVTHVVPDGPAAKAGFQENDILDAAGDKPLGKVEDLVAAVDGAKDQELAVELLREGKRITIKVTPEKRPEAPVRARIRSLPQDAPLRAWIEAWGDRPERVLRMAVPRPGMLLGGAQLDLSLPGDMSVTIFKQGDEPAKITVKQGDQTWEVTEDKLGDLPEKVRGQVQALLGRGPQVLEDRVFQLRWPEAAPPVVAPAPTPVLPPVDQLRDILERLEKLQKAVEELQARQSESGT